MTAHLVYRLYGLAIESAVALPLPVTGDQGAAGVRLVYSGRSAARLPAAERGGRDLAIDDRGWQLRFRRMTGDWVSFRYCHATRQLVVTGTDAWDDIIPILFGVAAGVLLRDRGSCVFHGAAVAHRGGAVAVLGHSGAGKSTLAGALMAKGARLVTDDLIVPERLADGFAVQAGHRRLSLERDAADALPLNGTPSVWFPSRSKGSKLWIDADALPGGFATEPARLSAIYVLEPRDASRTRPEVVALPARSAAVALMQQVYGVDWIGQPTAELLRHCTEVASRLPVARLRQPHDLAALADTAELLLAATFATVPT
jgi:hypothetical protein